MAAARHLLAPGDPPRPDPHLLHADEEIGRGVHPDFPPIWRRTRVHPRRRRPGEVDYETFSADKATVTIQGVSTHPGEAKGKLVNALHLAAKLVKRCRR